MTTAIKHRQGVISPELAAAAIPEAVKKIYAHRGVERLDEISLPLNQLLPPTALKGAQEAAEMLADAIEFQASVVIVGDFDADGATSCALAVSLLKQMGLEEVYYLVPNRFEYGYGLTPEIVGIAAQYQPDVLVTVDNGIASIDGVSAAHQLGMSVIITDHHLPGEELPEADIIVNPNQPGCSFPSKALAGVGVMFYVLTALRAELRNRGWFESMNIEMPNLADSLWIWWPWVRLRMLFRSTKIIAPWLLRALHACAQVERDPGSRHCSRLPGAISDPSHRPI